MQAENAQLRAQLAEMQAKGPEGGSLIGGQNVINIAVQAPASTQSLFGTEVSQRDLQALKDDILSNVDKRFSAQSVKDQTFNDDCDTRSLSDNLSSCKKSDWEKIPKGPATLYQQFNSATVPE